MRAPANILPLLCLAGALAAAELPRFDVELPAKSRRAPERIGRFDSKAIDECSGITASARTPGLFWTHNDSGDDARLFPVSRDGKLRHGSVNDPHAGLYIVDAMNVDWEDITSDGKGRLIIADTGNNLNTRRDLTLYYIDEPTPGETTALSGTRAVTVHFPDQAGLPPKKKNFDCEALFHFRGKAHLLTKHRSDKWTTLYRLDDPHPERSNPLTPLARFHARGMVTAAETSPDGSQVAVLAYTHLWVFKPAPEGGLFEGEAHWLPIRAGQAEALCWDGPDTLLLANEAGRLFRVPLDALSRVR